LRRRPAFAILIALLIVAVAIVRAQSGAAPASPASNLSVDDFDRMMTELSNWGRWGNDDQKGAVNLITPAKRKQALSAPVANVTPNPISGASDRRDAQGPWPSAQLAGLYITCARWLHQRDVATLGSDGASDVHPSGVDQIGEPVHALALVAMGMPMFDNLDLEAVSREAARLNRWEFLLSAAPVAVAKATGSILNPIATF
jgi:hypothetical protein